MSIFDEWRQSLEDNQKKDRAAQEVFWKDFCIKEQHIYEDLLGKKEADIKGTIKEFAEKYNMSAVEIMGFLDGISESLATEAPDLNVMTEDSEFAFTIDFEKLYWNMLKVPAEWLYTLPQWDGILTPEKREEITKSFKNRNTVKREEPKIGRNDPCPCGSGKKYKKCCGR